MTDREEFEVWAKDDFDLARDKHEPDEYASGSTQSAWMAWEDCAAIKQRRIDELEAQLRQVRAGSGGIAQNSPAGGHGMSGHRVSFAEPITARIIHPEPLEPEP